jgi:hypothetical protein
MNGRKFPDDRVAAGRNHDCGHTRKIFVDEIQAPVFASGVGTAENTENSDGPLVLVKQISM